MTPGDSNKGIQWEPAASDLLKRVPFFVRGFARKSVEEFVAARGRSQVTVADVEATRKAFLKETPTEQGDEAGIEPELFRVEKCRGHSAHCPFTLFELAMLAKRIERIVAESGWEESIKRRVSGPLLHHHRLRVAIAECPNACSQPQIRDIGVIAAEWPRAVTDDCTGCGRCEEACGEGAMRVEGERAELNRDSCIGCGLCVKHCPAHAIESGGLKFRLLVGGRLGRHPRLAREIAGELTEDELLAAITRLIALVISQARPEERFAATVARLDEAAIARAIAM